jgi:S1-C subfamily serine protease
VTPHEPRKRSRRTLIAVFLAVFGVAIALGGIALLHSTTPSNSTPLAEPGPTPGTAAAKAEGSDRTLSDRAVYDLISPSVVDITATLGYDDETASGTGFFVDPRDGLVLTNNHVIRDATSVTIAIPQTQQTFQAQIVGADTSADIAVLRIAPPPRWRSARPWSPSATGPARAARRCSRPG